MGGGIKNSEENVRKEDGGGGEGRDVSGTRTQISS
jgi:hypothetical protein